MEKQFILRITRWSDQSLKQIVDYSVFDFGLSADPSNLVDSLSSDDEFLHKQVADENRKTFTFFVEGVEPHDPEVYLEVVTAAELKLESRARWQKDLKEFCPEGWEAGVDCTPVQIA
jgi:hypothetical protein